MLDVPIGARVADNEGLTATAAVTLTFTGRTFDPLECAVVGVIATQAVTSVTGGGLAWARLHTRNGNGRTSEVWAGIGPKEGDPPVSGDIVVTLTGSGRAVAHLVHTTGTDLIIAGPTTNNTSSSQVNLGGQAGYLGGLGLCFTTHGDTRRSMSLYNFADDCLTEEIVIDDTNGVGLNFEALNCTYEPPSTEMWHHLLVDGTATWVAQSVHCLPPSAHALTMQASTFNGVLRNQRSTWTNAYTPPASSHHAELDPLITAINEFGGEVGIDEIYCSFPLPDDGTVESAAVEMGAEGSNNQDRYVNPMVFVTDWDGDRAAVGDFKGPAALGGMSVLAEWHRGSPVARPRAASRMLGRTTDQAVPALEAAIASGSPLKVLITTEEHLQEWSGTGTFNDQKMSVTSPPVLHLVHHPTERPALALSGAQLGHGDLLAREGAVITATPFLLSAVVLTATVTAHAEGYDLVLSAVKLSANISRDELAVTARGNIADSGIRTGTVLT